MPNVHPSNARIPFPPEARSGFETTTTPAGEMTASLSNAPGAANQASRRRILVCVDHSSFAEGCVPYAVWLAQTFGGAITIVQVMQPHHEDHARPMNDALGWEISRQEAKRYLERLDSEVSLALGEPAEIRLEQGRPAERIVDLATEIAADIIVLGSRGDGGASVGSLGRTAQQVLSLARCSVFIAHSSRMAPTEVTPKRILVPLDGSLRTESVLPAAARIANASGATLLLVHAVQEPLPTALLDAAEDIDLVRKLAERLEFGAKRYLEHLQQQLAREVTSVRTLVVRHSNERQCLLDVSQREQSDLIVLSAHGSACDSGRSFGSVTAFLLTHSTIPVLVLQDLPECDAHRIPNVDAQLSPPSLRASYASERA
jgi:nucleotide-binding universal stress UspA family protein